MKKLNIFLLFLAFSSMIFAQVQVVHDFEEPADSAFWDFEHSENADTNLTYNNISWSTANAVTGSAMTVDWAAHNIEGWGGYTKVEHIAPDSMVYDWSKFDTVSFYYYTETPQTLVGRTHLRFELYEVSDVPDTTSGAGDMEFYYSFHYGVCDDSTGQWHKISIPLEAGSYWEGQGFNRTGWAGVPGNDQLDKDKIKGWGFEFSISGAGEGDVSAGKTIFDDIVLSGVSEDPFIIFNGKTVNTTFTPFTWGQSSMEIVEGGGQDPKTNSLLWTQGDEWANGWSGAGWNIDPHKDLGFRWALDSLKFAMKAEAGTNSPIRVQFESPNGAWGYFVDVPQDELWHDYSIPLRDFDNKDGNKPTWDSTDIGVFQVMGEGNAQAGKKVWFDFIWTGNPPIDVVPPEAPTGVIAVAGTYQNSVTWIDVPNEPNSTYSIVVSDKAITSIDDPGVETVANGIAAGTQVVTHVLKAPLVDTDLTLYYAVFATDPAGNVGAMATSDAVTNKAKGIATIANDFTGFAADGDLAEWANVPKIRMYVSDNTGTVVNNTTIDNDADLSLDAYLAFDKDYLYFAADLEDDVIDTNSTDGETWMRDGVDLFIGLYNSRGAKHTSYKRGAEPDYHFRFAVDRIILDNPSGGDLAKTGSADYAWKGKFPTGYIVEGRISLDTLAAKGGDDRFTPITGMKLPLDYSINDADGSRREGIMTLSIDNQDKSWGDVSLWTYTWIGDKATDVNDDDITVNEYSLSQNYPNPFNPTTQITYSLVKSGLVTLKVYNLLGQEVASLVNKVQNSGKYSVDFDASNLASGVYVYRLQSGTFTNVKKMMLLK